MKDGWVVAWVDAESAGKPVGGENGDNMEMEKTDRNVPGTFGLSDVMLGNTSALVLYKPVSFVRFNAFKHLLESNAVKPSEH